MKFYVLTSENLKALKRHNDPDFSNILKKDTVIVINSLDESYVQEATEYCKVENLEHYITESNGTPSKGKNSVFDIFLASDNDYCVLIDGDDFLTPHGVWMYKHLEELETPPDAVCLINQISVQLENNTLYFVTPFTVDYYYLLSTSSYDTFKNYYGLSHEKSVYFDSLTTKYYEEQQKYSEGSEVHCRVTWFSRKAAMIRFNEDLIIGEDTLQMLELKHEALEGRLNVYTTDEKPATYIYDQREGGTVVIETNFGEDCEWMDTYLKALEDIEHVGKLHENTRLPELQIQYPQDYIYNDLGLTEPNTYTLKVAA